MKLRALLSPALLAGLLVVVPTACEDDPATAIVVAISSEAEVPRELDSLGIRISRGSNVHFAQTYEVDKAAGKVALPGTLTVKPRQGEEASTPITVEIFGNLGPVQVVLRTAKMTFVQEKQKLLRLVLRYSCIDVPLACESQGLTCLGGKCGPVGIDPTSLPDYRGEEVFPQRGQAGCFDASDAGCARDRTTVDDLAAFVAATCTFETKLTSEQMASLNVFAFWTSKADQAHPLPLEHDPTEGWFIPKEKSSSFQLAPGLCEAVQQGRIRQLDFSTVCPSKKPEVPVCLPNQDDRPLASFFSSACHRCVYQDAPAKDGIGTCKEHLDKAMNSSSAVEKKAATEADQLCRYDGHYDNRTECRAVRDCFFQKLGPALSCGQTGTCGDFPNLAAWVNCLDGYEFETACAQPCTLENDQECRVPSP